MSVKKIAILLLLVSLASLPAWASLGAKVAWDVRTTGNNSNGGCFDSGVASPGTDRSQQDAAQTAYTDLVIGATTTQLTSVAHPFTSADAGNCIQITGGTGFTTGIYEVSSVSGSTATMDRSVGTAASSGGTGNLGGGLLTFTTPFASCVDGNAIYIKKGTYTVTSTYVLACLPTLDGYNATHGDLDGGTWSTINGNRPLITTATNSTPLFEWNHANGAYPLALRNLSLSNTASTRAVAFWANVNPIPLVIDNTLFDGFVYAVDGTNRNLSYYYKYIFMTHSEVKNSTTGAIVNNLSSSVCMILIDNYIHDNASNSSDGGTVACLSGIMAIVESTIITATSGNGANFFGASDMLTIITNSDIANNAASVSPDGIGLGATALAWLENNIIYGNGGWGITGGASKYYQAYYNGFGGNTSGSVNPANGLTTGYSPISFSANPFTSSTNFGLNSTSGGGAAAKAAGFPGVFPGGASTSYPDLGAVQSQAGAGGGSSSPFAYTN